MEMAPSKTISELNGEEREKGRGRGGGERGGGGEGGEEGERRRGG